MQDSGTKRDVEPLVTKRSLGWAGAAAFLACAACCAVPLLAVAGGGALAAATAWWTPGLEPYAAAVAALAMFGVFAVRGARQRSCSTACAADGTCCPDGRQQRRVS